MDRASFLRSLFVAAAAPKIIVEAAKDIVSRKQSMGLIQELNTLTPDFYRQLIRKYSDDNYYLFMQMMDSNPSLKNTKTFYHYESDHPKTGSKV